MEFGAMTCLYGVGADLPALTQIPKFLDFALQTHAEIGWLFMYVHYGPFTKN